MADELGEIDELLRERDRPAVTARGAERRKQITEAAVELFGEFGFHGTSMDQIGSAAGVSGPALYHHFRNKQAILAAVFFQAGDRMFEMIATASREIIDPAERLRAVIEQYVDAAMKTRDVWSVLYAELRNLPAADSDRFLRRRRLFNEYLAHGIAQLRTDLLPSETQQMASAIVWMIHSIGFVEPTLEDESLRPFLTSMALATIQSADGYLSTGQRHATGDVVPSAEPKT